MQMHKQSIGFHPSQYITKNTTHSKQVAHEKGHKAMAPGKKVARKLLHHQVSASDTIKLQKLRYHLSLLIQPRRYPCKQTIHSFKSLKKNFPLFKSFLVCCSLHIFYYEL